MLREAFVLLLIQRILSFEKLSIDSSSTSTPVQHITPVQHMAFIHCIICLPVQNLPHDSVCPDSCRPPRKNMTLYFHISMFRHNFCSCPVRLVLSYCIQTSPYLIPTPVVVNVQHPQSKLNAATTPTMSSRLSKNALQTTNPKVRYMYFVRSPTPSCLPAHMYPPTYLCFTKRSIRNISSERSAKSPHGCLCHLTPIHSQIVMRLVLRRLVVKDGLVWCRRVLVRWSGCDAWRRRRSTIVILVGGHLHFFSFLFFSLLGSWSGKTMGLFVLARH